MSKPEIISSFQGEYRFLSNFWYVRVNLDGMEFRTVEHAYQAAKTTDLGLRHKFQLMNTPGQAKRLGGVIGLREGWDDMKLSVMTRLLLQKFAPKSDLLAKLLATGDAELIEGNTWGDRYWGVCEGQGENNLGKLLMEIRRQSR